MPEEIVREQGENEELQSNASPEQASERMEQSSEITFENAPEQTEGKYDEILSKVSSSATGLSPSDQDIALDAKSISETTDEESKIQKLLDLAETKGVVHAVKVARSLKDYYALDKMHDELADRLYEGLLAKGMIEKE